jgi:hypothetical protein
MPLQNLLLDTKQSKLIMKKIIIIIKEKEKFLRCLLSWRFKSTSDYYKATQKHIHNTMITQLPNKALRNRQYNINVTAIGK